MSSIFDCLRNFVAISCLLLNNPHREDQASASLYAKPFEYSSDHQGWGQMLFFLDSSQLNGLAVLYQRVKVPSFHLNHQFSSILRTVGARHR